MEILFCKIKKSKKIKRFDLGLIFFIFSQGLVRNNIQITIFAKI